MSNGKICVSVCAKSADELTLKIRRAEKFADVVELRFDCLARNEVRKALTNLPSIKKQYLITFRPKNQGGMREFTIGEQLKFWERVFWALEPGFMIDIELDPKLLNTINPEKTVRIVSSHDFTGGPKKGPLVDWDLLSSLIGNNIKIAVQADDITDSIPVWKLLEYARDETNKIIPIAMGEAGKWTRILGMAHGAFMTYASLKTGNETAPGQISAEDLIDVYRVRELDEKTAVYGIIGGNTSYSVSPFMHNAAFKKCNLNSVFVPLQVKNLDEFMRRMVKSKTREIELNFAGFSVTIPHKQAILKHLDSVDETARKIGAVNTVKVENGKYYGFNTDAYGFIEPLKNICGDLQNARVAVFGAGGAARACIYALKEEGADVSLLARDPQKADVLARDFGIPVQQLTTDNRQLTTGFDIIINATPLGTKGAAENETVADAEQLEGVKLVYDLVYNPGETRLIREAKAAGILTLGGLEMLVEQGANQFKIWSGQTAPVGEMTAAVRKRLIL